LTTEPRLSERGLRPGPRPLHPRETIDPKRLALLAKADAARASFERWYRRLKRAMTGREKARRHMANVQRQPAKLDNPVPVG
jgi:hypothetical protein